MLATLAPDAFRISFFADDFHFLDIARRFSLPEVLTGAYGIWPWYRPISRELYFELVDAFRPHGLAAAHTISLLVCLGIAILIWRIGRRWFRPGTAVIAIALFSTYEYTKFVVSSAMCFQDLFALFWMLLALDAHVTGRRWLAAAAIFLAPLAKETGFALVPLLVAYDLLFEEDRRFRSRWLVYAAAALPVIGLNLLARSSWPAVTHEVNRFAGPERLAENSWEALRGFVSEAPAAPPGAWTIARIAIALGGLALLGTAKVGPARPAAPAQSGLDRRAIAFVGGAAILSALPYFAAASARLTVPLAYHLFPAVPWASLLIARGSEVLPARVRGIAIAALVAWNTVATAWTPPDMNAREMWKLGSFDWPRAVRLSAMARRLGEDLRRELAARPESLVVLYESVPAGGFLQTGDGPATRVLLGDPGVRTYFLNSPPPALELHEARLAILTFDPDRLHLRKVDWSQDEILLRAMKAVIAARADVAAALLVFRASADPNPFDRSYCRAAADLLLHGPQEFVASLGRAGLPDTTGARPAEISSVLSAEAPGLGAAMRRMLRSPRSAAGHAALADSMLNRGVLPGAGLELRIATALDPLRHRDRFRLAVIMLRIGGATEALAELEALAAHPGAGPLAADARRLAHDVRQALPPDE